MGSLRRWWNALWGRPAEGSGPVPVEPEVARPVAGGAVGDDDARRVPARRRYTAPPADDDAQREAHLGVVLQALTAGPLSRSELRRRVETEGWGPGRLDAVVHHGIATRVLVETDDGAVRARYAD